MEESFFCKKNFFPILVLFISVGCCFLSWKFGKYQREKDYIIYTKETLGGKNVFWEVAMRKDAFPECFETDMVLRVWDAFENPEEDREQLLDELCIKIEREKNRLENRKKVASKQDRLKLIQILVDPILE